MMIAKKDYEFIRERAQILPFTEGQFLFHEGDACAAFVYVRSGEIKVQKVNENGRQVTLYHVAPGDICILTTACLIGSSPYQAEGVAVQGGELYALSRSDFRDLLSSSESFREFVFQFLGERIAGLILKIDEIAFSSISDRLAKYLISAAGAKSEIAQTHQTIAQELGTAREVVSRQLKEFERRGLIKTERNHIILLNLNLKNDRSVT